MQAIYRQLTAALLLSSYLLATAATWLHTGHPCPVSGASGCAGVTRWCAPCDGHDESASLPVPRLVGSDHRLVQSDESSGEHRHQSDQCLLCRFLVTKKSAEIPAGLTSSSAALPEPVALAVPTFRVAELLAAPACRAPPHVC